MAAVAETPPHLQGLSVSDPYSELPINNAKYIRDCTELHLGSRGIEALWNFERFTNLEVLWVNDNKVMWCLVVALRCLTCLACS